MYSSQSTRVEVRRASHAHQTPHAGCAQIGPVSSTTVQNAIPVSAEATASQSHFDSRFSRYPMQPMKDTKKRKAPSSRKGRAGKRSAAPAPSSVPWARHKTRHTSKCQSERKRSAPLQRFWSSLRQPNRPMARKTQHSHSSRRYSPKSHTAVKNTTSNAARIATQSHRSAGFTSKSAAVASVLAIRSGVSKGSSKSGSISSRIRACAETAESAVPVTASPKLPRKSTKANCGKTASNGTLYRTVNTGIISSSVRNRNRVLALSFARKMANGSATARRSAPSVSLFCSRKKQDCSISEAANRKASHSSPGPNRRDSVALGSNVKLNSTTTSKTKTMVVVSSSRERNSVRSSLPSSADVFASKFIAHPKTPVSRSGPRLRACQRPLSRVPAGRRAPPVPKARTLHADSSQSCSPHRASRAIVRRATAFLRDRARSPVHPAATNPAPAAGLALSPGAAAFRAKTSAPANRGALRDQPRAAAARCVCSRPAQPAAGQKGANSPPRSAPRRASWRAPRIPRLPACRSAGHARPAHPKAPRGRSLVSQVRRRFATGSFCPIRCARPAPRIRRSQFRATLVSAHRCCRIASRCFRAGCPCRAPSSSPRALTAVRKIGPRPRPGRCVASAAPCPGGDVLRAACSAANQFPEHLFRVRAVPRVLCFRNRSGLQAQLEPEQPVLQRIEACADLRVNVRNLRFRADGGALLRKSRRAARRRADTGFRRGWHSRCHLLTGSIRRHGYNRLPRKQKRQHTENHRQSAEKVPFRSVKPSRHNDNLRSIAGPALTLRSRIRALRSRRRRPRDVHCQRSICRNVLAPINVHAVLLTARLPAIAADLHGWRRHNQHLPGRIGTWRQLYHRSVIRVRQLIREADRALPWPEGVRDRVAVLRLVDWRLHDRHFRRTGSRYLLQFRSRRQRKLKIPRRAEKCLGGLRNVLDEIFLANRQLRSIRLKNDRSRGDLDRLWVRCRLENLHLHVALPGRRRLVKIHILVDRAHQHRLRAQVRIVKAELPLRAGNRACHRLHGALQLNQDHLHAGRRLACRAIFYRAFERAAHREPREKERHRDRKRRGPGKSRHPLHRAPRGRRVCASVTRSISASTSAASFSSDAFIAS